MYPFIYLLCMISSLFIYYLLYLLYISYASSIVDGFLLHSISIYIFSLLYILRLLYILYLISYFLSYISYLWRVLPSYNIFYILYIICIIYLLIYLLYLLSSLIIPTFYIFFLQLSSLYTKQPVYIYPSSTSSYISSWSFFVPSSSVKSAY